MRIHLFLFILTFFFYSCKPEEDTLTITMKDGYTMTINTIPKYYQSEDEFIHGVSFAYELPYNFSDFETLEYKNNSEGKVIGYDQYFIRNWEIAKFGEWIRTYGLEPNTVYYVATKVYVKYVSMPPEDLRIVPKPGGQFMGYCPDTRERNFRTYNIPNKQVSALITGVRLIGYNSARNNISSEIPSFMNNLNNKLVWNYLIRDSGWD